mmetsp:Transcript_21999/g.62868  ORF Transcript_21999/g.62868 Transcript_21999/m.62868 type:complete len:220 (-) Transcript_21999:16-675(-)
MRLDIASGKSLGKRTSSSSTSVGSSLVAAMAQARSWLLKMAPTMSAHVLLGMLMGKILLRKASSYCPSDASRYSSGMPRRSASATSPNDRFDRAIRMAIALPMPRASNAGKGDGGVTAAGAGSSSGRRAQEATRPTTAASNAGNTPVRHGFPASESSAPSGPAGAHGRLMAVAVEAFPAAEAPSERPRGAMALDLARLRKWRGDSAERRASGRASLGDH